MKQDTNLLSLAAAAAAGALFMHYLDSKNGARRRAQVRDKVMASGHDIGLRAQDAARRATGRMKGMAAGLRGAVEPASDEKAGKQPLAAHATAPAPDSWNEQGV
jgi:hypothetical protein